AFFSAALLARHPGLLANPAAGALHRAAHRLAGAVVRSAGARIEAPATRRPALASNRFAGAVDLLGLPVARADLHLLFRPHRLAGVVFADAFPLLLDGLVAGLRHLAGVLLVDRFIRAV